MYLDTLRCDFDTPRYQKKNAGEPVWSSRVRPTAEYTSEASVDDRETLETNTACFNAKRICGQIFMILLRPAWDFLLQKTSNISVKSKPRLTRSSSILTDEINIRGVLPRPVTRRYLPS